jgi:hypothetical protein
LEKGEVHTGYWWGHLRKIDHFEDLGIDWVNLAKDKDRWHPLVSAVMNFGCHKELGISRLAADMFASLEGLCSMELVTGAGNSESKAATFSTFRNTAELLDPIQATNDN